MPSVFSEALNVCWMCWLLVGRRISSYYMKRWYLPVCVFINAKLLLSSKINLIYFIIKILSDHSKSFSQLHSEFRKRINRGEHLVSQITIPSWEAVTLSHSYDSSKIESGLDNIYHWRLTKKCLRKSFRIWNTYIGASRPVLHQK